MSFQRTPGGGIRRFVAFVVAALIALPVPPFAPAAYAATAAELEEQMTELERKLEILTEELRKMKEDQAVPEDPPPLESEYGLGPAASKVYKADLNRVSIGGYGEFNYKSLVSDAAGGDDEFDFLRFVLYFGYKFTDKLIFNSELEWEHASTGENGSVSVEFATLDYLASDRLNFRAGLLLVPVGFVNEMHEPPFFHGNDRPAVERQIIPSTWRANGAGIFGELMPGLDYRTYVVTSLRAEDFSSSNLRGGRQKGSEEIANDVSWVGRLDWNAAPGFDLSVSAYLGNQGQDADIPATFDIDGNVTSTTSADAFMQMYEAHAQWKWRGFESRALIVWTDLDDADVLSVGRGQTVAENMFGWYAEVAYDIGPLVLPWDGHYLAPWFRYSKYDTQFEVPDGFVSDQTRDRFSYEFGLSYKPIANVVLKFDYRLQDSRAGNQPDEIRIGAGYVF